MARFQARPASTGAGFTTSESGQRLYCPVAPFGPAYDVVDELTSMGAEAEKFQADITKEADVQKLVADVVDRFGSLDVLITTASVWRTLPLTEITGEDVLKSFQVNTLGTFLCCQHAGLQMVSQSGGGAIVTNGDSLIHHPYLDHAAYFTAKGSIPTLTRAFAVE